MERPSSANQFHQRLPSAIQLHILSLLPQNERAISGRLVSPETRDGLAGAQDCTASLSQPLLPHDVPWAMAAGQQHVRQLPFRHKLQLLCSAAASGSETNLEVAWALLQPSVFPELMQSSKHDVCERLGICEPGEAAVTAGHPQLLGWLLQHCPALLRPDKVLQAAARHCTLAGLQATWQVLQEGMPILSSSSGRLPALSQEVLDAAAESGTPDAVAKMEWVLASGAGACTLRGSTLLAAAKSGDLDRLRWLHDHGCRTSGGRSGHGLIQTALQHCDLAVARWLVGEAGCALPEEGQVSGDRGWYGLLRTAAESADGVAKLQWLQDNGAPSLTADRSRLHDLAVAAALAGRAEVVRYLVSLYRPDAVLQGAVGVAADGLAGSDGKLIAADLRQGGISLSESTYKSATWRGDLDTVRWLVREAGVSVAGVCMSEFLRSWPSWTAAKNRDLLEAVQLLVAAGCRLHGCLSYYIADRGNLALVQYLQQQCPRWSPDGKAVVPAAMGGCEALLEWVVEEPDNLFDTAVHASPYIVAAKRGDRGTLAALRRLGVPWELEDLVFKALYSLCPLPAVRWLAEQGAPVGSKGDMEKVVKWRLMGEEPEAWLKDLVASATDGDGCGW